LLLAACEDDIAIQWRRTLLVFGMIDPLVQSTTNIEPSMKPNQLNVNIAAYLSAMMLLNIRQKSKESWTEDEAEAVRTFFKSLATPLKVDSPITT